MAGREVVGTGVVQMDIEDKGYKAKLRQLDAEHERTLQRMDGRRAEATITADIKPLERKIAQAEKDLAKLEQRRASAGKMTPAEKAALNQQIAGANKVLKAHKEDLSVYKQLHKEQQSTNAENELAYKKQKLANTELIKSLRTQTQDQAKLAREAERGAAARERELRAAPKLHAEYVRIQRTLDRAPSRLRRAKSGPERVQVQLDTGALESKLRDIRERLLKIGQPPIEVDIRPARSMGERFNAELRKSIGERGKIAGFASAGVVLGKAMGDGTIKGLRQKMQKDNIKASLASNLTGAADWAANALTKLSSASVRLGPFTTSVRGAIVAASLLGPVLVDVAGAAGSLISVVGSAAAGLGALTAGVVGGAVPGLLGMGLVVKDVVQEFTAVKKAQKAYDDAVQKGNTELATKKLKELRAVMGNVSEETAKQVLSAQRLGGAWDKLTSPARASVWTAVGDGIRTAKDLMPLFAKNTNEAMAEAQTGTSKWLSALRSAAGHSTLNKLMDSFTASIQPAMSAVGSLIAYLGKLGASAARYLPGMMQQFAGWAAGVNKGADNVGALNQKVDKWMDSLASLGRFLQASGRFLVAFFSAGTEAGQGFLDTMTQGLNKWTSFLKIGENKNNLSNYFKESVEGVKSLWSFLKPVASGFAAWATALAPTARVILNIAGALTSFATGLLKLTVLQGPITALAYTLGTLWAVNKVGAAARGIAGFIAGLFGMSRAQVSAAAATQIETAALNEQTAALARNAAAQRGAAAGRTASAVAGGVGAGAYGPMGAGVGRAGIEAEKTAAKVSRLGRAGGIAKTALSGLGAVLVGAPSLLAGVGIAAAAAGYGIYRFVTRTRESEKAQQAFQASQKRTSELMATIPALNADTARSTLDLAQSSISLTSARRAESDAEKTLKTLRSQGKQGTREYRDAELQSKQATLDVSNAILQQNEAKRQQTASYDAEKKAIDDTTKSSVKNYMDAKDKVAAYTKEHERSLDTYQKVSKEAKRLGISYEEAGKKMHLAGWKDAEKVGAAFEKMNKQERDAFASMNANNAQGLLGMLNLKRAMEGLPAIGAKAAASFASIAKQAGALGSQINNKIATKFQDPGKAARVAQSTAASLKSGTSSKMVLNIIANSANAEAAIKRLQQARITSKRLDIIANGGSDALAQLKNIVGVKLAPKVQKILEKGGTTAAQKIQMLKDLKIPDKTARAIVNGTETSKKKVDILSAVIRNLTGKNVRVSATTAGQQAIDALKSAIAGVVSKSVTITARKVGDFFGGKAAGGISMRAAGGSGGQETPGTQLRMDRAAARERQGLLPRMSTTQLQGGAKISGGARAIYGEEAAHPEIVLSTNPSYRKSNLRYLRMAAEAMGVSMAASGKGKKTAAQKKASMLARSKSQATNQIKNRGWKSSGTGAAGYLAAVETAKTNENNQSFNIDRAEGQLKEPDTFVDVSKDPVTGDDIYTINKAKIASWVADLDRIRGMYQRLLELIGDTGQAIRNANKALGNVKNKADSNTDELTAAIAHENETINSKGASSEAKANAKARRAIYIDQRANEIAVSKDAGDDIKDMKQEGIEADHRWLTATDARNKWAADADGAAGRASSELSSASGSGSGGSGGVGGSDLPSAGEMAISRADANAALADIGLGGISKSDAAAAQKAAQELRLSEGQAMLSDNTTANDAQGYSIITGAASAIKSYNDQQASDANDTAAKLAEYNQKMSQVGNVTGDILKQFGSNIQNSLGIGAGQQVGGQAGKVVNITNNYKSMPTDPHTWSKTTAFELQAAL